MGWDFKNKADAETLLRLARESGSGDPINGGRKYARAKTNQTILVKTPAGGIGARSEIGAIETGRDEYQLGWADCVLLSTYDNGSTPNGRDQANIRSVRKPGLYSTSTGSGATQAEKDAWKDEITDVVVVNPFAAAIAGDQIITAVNIDGTYVATTPPPSQRVQFVLKTTLIDGSATGVVIESGTSGLALGTEITVTDTRKMFVGATGYEGTEQINRTSCIPADGSDGPGTDQGFRGKNGSIGWANYSGSTDSWDIEQATLPANKFSAITESLGSSYTGLNRFSGQDGDATGVRTVFTHAGYQLSGYPYVDFPPEFRCIDSNHHLHPTTFEFTVEVSNPHLFTIMPGSPIVIERRIEKVPASEYDSVNIPLDYPILDSPYPRIESWVITEAHQQLAKWVKVTSVEGSGGECEWEYAEEYRDGGDPLVFFGVNNNPAVAADIPVVPAQGIDYCCSSQSAKVIPKAGSNGWAWWDKKALTYVVVSTKSAMLGDPTGTDYISDVLDAGGSGCSLDLYRQGGLVGWKCENSQTTIGLTIPTKEIEYISGIGGGCNVICPTFEYATVLNCGANTGGRSACMNIYADPCVTCTGTCYWYWNGSEWTNDPSNDHDCDPNSGDCGCEGQEPPPWEIGQPVTQTTTCAVYNTPPEPTPCENCSNCSGGVGATITSLTYNCTFPSAQYAMVPDSAVNVGDCAWRVEIIWTEVGQADKAGFADITYDGTSWTVVSTTSATGEPGDFVYTSAVAGDCDGNFNLTESDPELTTSHIAGAASMGTTTTLCP
jgi:hypothetical protein